MVIRNSISNLSKYGIKNDDILSPVFNDSRISEFKSMFSSSMGYKSQRNTNSLDIPKKMLRSKSYNTSTHYLPSSDYGYISRTYRRSNSVCLNRSFSSSLPISNRLGSNKSTDTLSNRKLAMGTSSHVEGAELGRSYDSNFVNSSLINGRFISENGLDVFNSSKESLNLTNNALNQFNTGLHNSNNAENKKFFDDLFSNSPNANSNINVDFMNEHLESSNLNNVPSADALNSNTKGSGNKLFSTNVFNRELVNGNALNVSHFNSAGLDADDTPSNTNSNTNLATSNALPAHNTALKKSFKDSNVGNYTSNNAYGASRSNASCGDKHKNFWRRVSLGAFTPIAFGLDCGSLSALTIKGRPKTDVSELSEPSDPELSESRVFLRLLDKIGQLVKVKREKVAELHKGYASHPLGEVTLAKLFSGLKDVPAMVTETSELDPRLGIKFRGLTVDEMLRKLPGKHADCPYTESVLWYLLTGEVPDPDDVKDLSYELFLRSEVPQHVFDVMNSMPLNSHPLTQYVTAVSALQTESVFRRAYLEKTYQKDTCWKLALEDCLNLVAKNVVLVGYIYRRSFLDPNVKPEDVKYNSKLDYAANLAHFLGDNSELFSDLMRLYLALHSDHEGGNVSAHASHLVGSALADPYFCLSSALCGLSGPLHGMANQECLVWIKRMLKKLGPDTEITVERVKKYAEDTMAAGQVIPGYGHAVLKVTDPRHTAFVRFARTHFPNDPMVKLLDICLEAIPEVLKASGKVRNPNPNVDCSTGVLLSHFNIDQPQVFTVFFGLSRSLGILSQLVWARALRYPIERPKSLTLETVEKMCKSPEDLNSDSSTR